MFCQKCGKQLRDGAKFCNYCGFRIIYAVPVTPPRAPEERPSAGGKPNDAPAPQPKNEAPQPAPAPAAPAQPSAPAKANSKPAQEAVQKRSAAKPVANETPKEEGTKETAPVEKTPSEPRSKTTPRSKKRPLLLALAALIVVAVIITTIALLSGGSPEGPTSASDASVTPSASDEDAVPTVSEEPGVVLTRDEIVASLQTYCSGHGCTLTLVREKQSGANWIVSSYSMTGGDNDGKLSIEITEKNGAVSFIKAHYNENTTAWLADYATAFIDNVLPPFYCCEERSADEFRTWVHDTAGYDTYVADSYTDVASYRPQFETYFESDRWAYSLSVDGSFVYMTVEKPDGTPRSEPTRATEVETEPETEVPTDPPTEAIVISDDPLIFNDELLGELDMSYGELVQRYGSTTAVNYDYLKMYGTSFDFESAPGRTYLFKSSVPTDSPYGASSCNDGDPCERIVAPIGEVFTNFGDSCTVGELKSRLPQYTVGISGFGTYGCPTLQLFTEELNGFDILLAVDSSGSPYQLGFDVEDDYVLLPDVLVSITKHYK